MLYLLIWMQERIGICLMVSRIVILSAVLAFLSGCAKDMSDLEQFTNEIKQRDTGSIKPIREYVPYEPYVFIADRNPFIPLTVTDRQINQNAEIDDSLKPDGDRRKEPLEFFPLDALSMVGSVEKNKTIWALLQDPESAIHRVKIGNYVGQNYGRVMSVSDTQIVLNEIVQDSDGSWIERVSKIQIAGEDE